ncbi:MAG: TlpA family protein disulfide reductase [Fibrobacteria bacterium]|nr:TlpA family protein disulfide reductase [Fibrobacteria bacterium]
MIIKQKFFIRTIFPRCMVLFAFILLLTGCGNQEHTQNKSAPDFMLSDTDGNRFYLSAQKDTVLLLNFWSVHCVPCLQEMPLLQKLYHDSKGKTVKIVGICTDPAEAGYISTFLKGFEITYPVLLDPEGQVADLYKVTSLPTTFFVNGEGIIKESVIGYENGYFKKYQHIIEGLIQK